MTPSHMVGSLHHGALLETLLSTVSFGRQEGGGHNILNMDVYNLFQRQTSWGDAARATYMCHRLATPLKTQLSIPDPVGLPQGS